MASEPWLLIMSLSDDRRGSSNLINHVDFQRYRQANYNVTPDETTFEKEGMLLDKPPQLFQHHFYFIALAGDICRLYSSMMRRESARRPSAMPRTHACLTNTFLLLYMLRSVNKPVKKREIIESGSLITFLPR